MMLDLNEGLPNLGVYPNSSPSCRLYSALPCKVIYIESIARTKKLSLSGKILYKLRLADLILVQWKELAEKLPGTKFAGRLY